MGKLGRPPRLAVLYPWSDLMEKTSGASRRVNLLLDFLNHYDLDVRVLHEGAESYAFSPRIQVEAVRLGKAPFLRRKFVKMLGRYAGEKHATINQYLRFHRADKNAAFAAKATDLLCWADALILKYPFYTKTLTQIRGGRSTPIVLAAHDLLHEQVSASRWLRESMRRIEFDSFRMADALVAVSEQDATHMREAGLNPVTIPHPIGRPSCGGRRWDDVARERNLPFRDKKICFFVGGDFPPNIDAVMQIRRIAAAASVRPELAQVVFVVAGRCAPRETTETLWCLGEVADDELTALYAAADVVICPLRIGTGASLKTIEAFSMGKCVVGTEVAFRGQAVAHGRHCIVENDIARYPKILGDLLSDPETRARLSGGAASYAERFDHRSAFTAYWPLLGIRPEPRSVCAPIADRT